MQARNAGPDACLGAMEIGAVPRGFEVADAMMKVAPITTLICRPMSPARFLLLFEGDVESVMRSLQRGGEVASDLLVGELMLPQPHPQLLEVVRLVRTPDEVDAFASLETTQVTATMAAADRAAKEAEVELMEMRLAMGLHGHGFFTMTGEISAVEAALSAAAAEARHRGALHDQVLIANPDKELKQHMKDPVPPFTSLP